MAEYALILSRSSFGLTLERAAEYASAYDWNRIAQVVLILLAIRVAWWFVRKVVG